MREAAGATIEFDKVLDLTYKTYEHCWPAMHMNIKTVTCQTFDSILRVYAVTVQQWSQWIFLWMTRLAPLSEVLAQVET